MIFKRISPITGKLNTLDLPVTGEQVVAWRNGKMIQDAMPNLTNSQREFILSGHTQEDWDYLYPKEEEK